ncbi:MAG TPA: lanthionine synthetase C family protein [Pyrinomonadaceae bacterium]
MRRRALASVNEIAAALSMHARRERLDASLAGGHAGLAVACAYLARAGFGDRRGAAKHLKRAARIASARNAGPSLHEGDTGVAWAATHLTKEFSDFATANINATVDTLLTEQLARSSRRGDYDLISGLVGFGVYALERLPEPAAVKCLRRVVDRLEECAVRRPEGITFQTPTTHAARGRRSEIIYDLGVAHGAGGVVAFLGGVCASGVACAKARPLLEGVARWLLKQKMRDVRRGCFPYFVGPHIRRKRARLAWCYGDAGLAASLLVAARGAGESVWEREALKLARGAAERGAERSGVVDATLCHGAAGVGHVFNRIFQMTGEDWSRRASSFWFARALEMRRPGEGVGGFLTFQRDELGEAHMVADAGLLEGAAGIALALLAASTADEPSWDRALLLSLPADAASKTAHAN